MSHRPISRHSRFTAGAKRRLPACGALLIALALSGCAAPPWQAPGVDVPPAFKEQQDPARWAPARAAQVQPDGAWWKVFNDPVLDALIDQAGAANANLAAAAARVRQARALAGISAADRSLNLAARAAVSRTGASGVAPGTSTVPATAWQGRLTASYEVDLFGRVAHNAGAAQADAAASEASFGAVLLALRADVAQTYFRLRASDAELAFLRRTVGLREENLRINQRRFAAGDVGELDLAKASTELSGTRSETIALERQRAQLEHALAVLLGKPAAAFSAASNPLPESASLPGIPAGLPSALLERRPDIIAAQSAMVAANARIGVARAAMFPALRLTADGGGESADLSDLFRWSSRSWLVGALMTVPVLDGGRSKAEIARSEAVLEESVASYRHSVLSAFADVDDNLAGLRTLAGQAQEIDAAIGTARRAEQLARKLYQGGHSGYLELLDAQRNLVTLERSAVSLRSQRAVSTVALIRALGGAWDSADATAP